MKVLVVSTVPTHPTTSGSGMFIKSYCGLLKEMGHEVFFLYVPFYSFREENRAKQKECVRVMSQIWDEHFFTFKSSVFDRIKEFLLNKYHHCFSNDYYGCDDRYPLCLDYYVNKLNKKHAFDACIVNYYWLSKLLPKVNVPRKGMIAHDSFTYNNERNGVKSRLNLTPSEEAKAMQRCPTIFAMQEEEKILFQRYAPHSKVLTSFCNYKYIEQAVIGNHNLVYLSSGFYLNVNGLKWFVDEIFPSILSVFPDCKLIIGGTLCREVPQYKFHSNIELLGLIDDPAHLYSLGDVAINPTYQGTGLKIKTFEAMAYDKVTMVHPHSVNGIFDKSNAPIFVSEKAVEWVDFLKKIWVEDKTKISEIKTENKDYIKRMNTYIINQFKDFLD